MGTHNPRCTLHLRLLAASLIALLLSLPATADSPTGSAAAVPQAARPAAEIRQHLADYLFDAARVGDDDILREFIAAHFNLNVRTEQGYTAVILAAYHGHESSVQLLLDHGADSCAKDNHGNTALMGALFKGELSIARTLAAAPCDPDERNNAGQTAAMYAALFGRVEIIKQLKDRGADLDTRDAAGNSANSINAATH